MLFLIIVFTDKCSFLGTYCRFALKNIPLYTNNSRLWQSLGLPPFDWNVPESFDLMQDSLYDDLSYFPTLFSGLGGGMCPFDTRQSIINSCPSNKWQIVANSYLYDTQQLIHRGYP